MMTKSQSDQKTSASVENMQIRIPESFNDGSQYIPIAKQTTVNDQSIPAIPEFLQVPPIGNYFTTAENAQLSFNQIPSSGKHIVTVQNGSIVFVEAIEGDLKIFNNSLSWTDTESCD
jgi:hypothetical protein